MREILLLGHPVAHSLSPRMQQAALDHAGLDVRYRAVDVQPGDLAVSVARVRADTCLGANVTLPHKRAVVSLCDGAVSPVDVLGAANTLVKAGGRLEAHNTDVGGLCAALQELDAPVRDGTALVLGGSGAALAATEALARLGAARIIVAARRPGAAAAGLGPVLPIDSSQVAAALQECSVLVNATSAGLDGESTPLERLPRRPGFLYDLVYRPSPTPLMRLAAAAGWVVHDGQGMLLHQGAQAFQLWTRLEPPLAVMRRALVESVA